MFEETEILASVSVKAIVFGTIFALSGIVGLLITSASSPSPNVAVEAESGSNTSNSQIISSSSASGNKYVKFNTPAPPPPSGNQCTTFNGPITITAGGTYTGCWQTTDGVTPAVKISTTQPVIITNSTIKGNYILIQDGTPGVNLSVSNTSFLGITPTSVVASRRAIRLGSKAINLNVTNSYFENNSGIKVTGWANTGSANNTVTILRNKVKNITNQNISTSGQNDSRVQFVQLGQINQISNVEIAWNEVINTYQQSRVEDNINLYQTGGAGDPAASRIRIHDNFIWGGYPNNATDTYNGGGIIAGDTDYGLSIGWVDIYNNQVVGTTNYGVSIVCGHDNRAYSNRIIGSGLTPSGQLFAAANVGLNGNAAWRWGGRCNQGNYINNSEHDNYVGWMNSNNKRQDMHLLDVDQTTSINNTSVQPANAAITYAMEQAEYPIWQQKLSSNHINLGPQ